MKNLNQFNKYRVTIFGYMGDEACGAFEIPYRSYRFTVVASASDGWEHVSVSLPNRCPNWEEMSFFKDMFFEETECVMQLHPPKEDYINNHNYCLHLWKPIDKEIPRPPLYMV